MGTRRRVITCFVGAALLAACGNGPEGAASAPDDPDERPCSKVVESLDEPNRIRAQTFDGGPEDRESLATIVEIVQQRPDCFSHEQVEFVAEIAETLPSEAQLEAIEAAEAACDDVGGEFSRSDSVAVRYDSPEEALAGDQATLPDGVPERAHEGDGRVDFEFHDEAGDFRGWAMVERGEGGWFLRRGITCGARTADP